MQVAVRPRARDWSPGKYWPAGRPENSGLVGMWEISPETAFGSTGSRGLLGDGLFFFRAASNGINAPRYNAGAGCGARTTTGTAGCNEARRDNQRAAGRWGVVRRRPGRPALFGRVSHVRPACAGAPARYEDAAAEGVDSRRHGSASYAGL